MMGPAGILAALIMVHPSCRVTFREALFHGPPHATEPDEEAQGYARWGMTDRGRVRWLRAHCALDPQPDAPLWQPLLTQRDPLARQRIRKRAVGSFRDGPPIPPGRWQGRRHRRHGTGVGRGGDDDALRGCFPLRAIRVLRRRGALKPAARLRRDRYERRAPPTGSDGLQTVRAVPIQAIRYKGRAREQPLVRYSRQHGRRQLWFGVAGEVLGPLAGDPSSGMRVVAPIFRQEEALLNERRPLARGIGRPPPHLTMLHLAQAPTVLPGNPYRVRPFLGTARLIEDQHAVWSPQGVGYKLMGVPPPLLLVPAAITEKPRHPTDGPPLNPEGDRLNGLAFQLTAWANHRVKAMEARLAPRPTVVEGRLQLPECVHEPFHIAGDQVKCRHRKPVAFRPTGWEHTRPPGEMGSRERQRIEGRLSCQLQTSL